MIHLDIRDADGYAPTKQEMAAFVKSGEVKTAVPEGAKYIASGTFTLERQPGFCVRMAMSEERAGTTLSLSALVYQIYFRGKGIGPMSGAMGPDDQRPKVDGEFELLTLLCRQVLNSLVLPQA